MNHELHSCSQRPLAPSNQTPPAYGHLPSDRGGVGSAMRVMAFLSFVEIRGIRGCQRPLTPSSLRGGVIRAIRGFNIFRGFS